MVVDTRQLPDLVIGVFRDQRTGLDLRDVPVVVVGIGQRHSALRDLLDQACGAVRPLAARKIGVSRRYIRGCRLQRTCGEPIKDR